MPLTTGENNRVERQIYDYVTKDMGLNTAIACGILANAEAESNFKSTATGDSGAAYGLFQWRDSRRNNLIDYCSKNNRSVSSAAGQLRFMDYELRGVDASEWQAYSFIKDVPDTRQGASDAGYEFCYYYERPKDKRGESNKRALRAMEFYDYYRQNPVETIQYNGSLPNSSSNTDIDYSTPISATIVSYDLYSDTIASNQSMITAEGYDYGYLIALDPNSAGASSYFKFYIPEFPESAGANWNPISIMSRSVQVMSYDSTNSRKVDISLDLYAGEGLYLSSDPVGQLHKDLNFLKSLEYPDYSSAIVRPPFAVQLILGPTIDMIGVVNGVHIEHMKPFDSQNRSMYAKVSFTVTQIAENPPDYLDIREGKYSIPSTSDIGSIGGGTGGGSGQTRGVSTTTNDKNLANKKLLNSVLIQSR